MKKQRNWNQYETETDKRTDGKRNRFELRDRRDARRSARKLDNETLNGLISPPIDM